MYHMKQFYTFKQKIPNSIIENYILNVIQLITVLYSIKSPEMIIQNNLKLN